MISDKERTRLALKEIRRLENGVARQRKRLDTERKRFDKAREKLEKIGRGERGPSLEDGTPLPICDGPPDCVCTNGIGCITIPFERW